MYTYDVICDGNCLLSADSLEEAETFVQDYSNVFKNILTVYIEVKMVL